MNRLTKLILCAVAIAAIIPVHSQQREQRPEPPAPIELFNGHDLTGWKGYLDDSSLDTGKEFTVRDGVIHLSGKLGYLHTEEVYSNFKLEVEWRWPETATNSGIFVRVQPEYQALPEAFECQLQAGNAGDLYAMAGASTNESAASHRTGFTKMSPSNEKPVGEWNRAEITCKRGEITVIINGTLQNHVNGAIPLEGYVGLQSEGEAIEFRNIILTPIVVR
jgi:hypothetical protein